MGSLIGPCWPVPGHPDNGTFPSRLCKLSLGWFGSPWWETKPPIPVLPLTLGQSHLPSHLWTENGYRFGGPWEALRVQEEPELELPLSPSSLSAERALARCLE